MLKGLGALGDMTKMMKAAQEMQGKLAALQEELARIVVLGEAGGGTVKARVTAKGVVTGLDIDPSLLDPAQKEVVEDLIIEKEAANRGISVTAEEIEAAENHIREAARSGVLLEGGDRQVGLAHRVDRLHCGGELLDRRDERDVGRVRSGADGVPVGSGGLPGRGVDHHGDLPVELSLIHI